MVDRENSFAAARLLPSQHYRFALS